MTFFRQYIAPLFIVLVFLVALLAVSARIFLPSDMAAPAPVEDVESASNHLIVPDVDTSAELPRVDAPIATSARSIH